MNRKMNLKKSIGVIFLAVCLFLTSGCFVDFINSFKDRLVNGITAKAADGNAGESGGSGEEYFGELAEKFRTASHRSNLYNFIHVTKISDLLKATESGDYYSSTRNKGIGSQYGRLGITDVYTKYDVLRYLDDANVTPGNQTGIAADQYYAEKYDFKGVVLSLAPGGKDDLRKNFIRLQDAVDAFIPGKGNPASGCAGCYTVTGISESGKTVVAVREKIGGGGLMNVNPKDGFGDVGEIDSFHLDYNVSLKLIPQEQRIYDYIKVNKTYYRLKKSSGFYGLVPNEAPKPVQNELYPFTIFEDNVLSNLVNEDERATITVNNVTYEFRESGYRPADPTNFTPFFTIELDKIEVSDQLSGSYDNSNLWLGLSEDHDWPQDNNTTAYHRNFVATLHNADSNYKITFLDDEGEVLKEYTAKMGVDLDTVYDIETPTKVENGVQYVFVGWENSRGEQFTVGQLPLVDGPETFAPVFEEPDPEITVEVTANPESGVSVGDEITFSVVVTNTESIPVEITEIKSLVGAVSVEGDATLSGGVSKTFTYEYTFTQLDFDAGYLVDTVTVSCKTSGGKTAEADDSVEVTAASTDPKITVSLTVSPESDVAIGEVVTFTAVVKNTGNIGVKNVSVTSNLRGESVADVFTLAPESSKTIVYTYTVAAADDNGEVVEKVTVKAVADRGDDPKEVSDEATVTVKEKNPNPIVITSSTKSWLYDGEPHRDDTFKVTYNGSEVSGDENNVFVLPTGDKLTITATAKSVEDYGEYSENNTFNYILENSDDYSDVTFKYGTLSIEKREVTVEITGNSKTAEYDGEEQSVEGYRTKIIGDMYTADDFEFSGEATVSGTDADIYTMGLSEDYFRNTNKNFDVTFEVTEDGVLTIEPKEVAIEWTGTEFPYDGKEHAPTATITNLADGDKCVVTVDGAGTEIGEYTATAKELSNKNYKLPEKCSASFEIYGCTVTFVDGDGKTLQSGVVPFGEKPEYKGETPTKKATEKYTYTFKEWSPEIVEVAQKETTYTAQFTETEIVAPIEKEYFLNAVKYGDGSKAPQPGEGVPVYTKESGVSVIFEFKGNVNDAETFNHFKSVSANGKPIPVSGFKKTQGSVIIEVLPEYLDTLEPGSYTLTALFDDAEAGVDAKITIEAKQSEPTEPDEPVVPSPKTADTFNIGFTVLAMLAVAGVVIVTVRRREENA